MKAEEILDKVKDVLAERGKHYTRDEERNMETVVKIFNLATGRAGHLIDIMDTNDGWLFMLCVKLVRAAQDPTFKLDHYLDMAGYAALAAEERMKTDVDPRRTCDEGAPNYYCLLSYGHAGPHKFEPVKCGAYYPAFMAESLHCKLAAGHPGHHEYE